MAKKENLVEGLEVNNEVETSNVKSKNQNQNFSDRKWLEENDPTFPEEQTSAKYDAEREPKVQNGLKVIQELGIEINPLVLLLGKWWENKNARAEIKKMIDAEAEAKGIADDKYLQIDLRENVDKLSTIQNACDRLKYAITYFKPRGGLSNKTIFKQISISGELYNVPMDKLVEIKSQYPDPKDKAKMIAEIIKVSTKIEIESL